VALTPFTTLTTGSSATDANSYNTASVTPTANQSVLVAVQHRQAAGTPEIPTVSGCNLTWTQIGTFWPSSAAGTRRISFYLGIGPSPTTGALTIGFNGVTQTQAMWTVQQLAGVAAVVGSVAGAQSISATTLTCTLAAFGNAANIGVGCFCHLNSAVETTPGSGFTEVADIAQADGTTGFQVEWATNDTTVDASWPGSYICWAAAVELTETAGGGAVVKDIMGGIIPFAR
jgi:hypothetical protein